MLRTRRYVLIVLALALAGACVAPASAGSGLTPEEKNLLKSLNGNAIKCIVSDLCMARFAGRRAGSPGQAAAAVYIADGFRKARLNAFRGGYLQCFPMRYSLVESSDDIRATLAYRNGRAEARYSFAYPDYYGRGGLDVKAETLFVGHGITDPVSDRDDYRGLNAAGKVVVWLGKAPPGAGAVASAVSARILNAYQHGAAASLVVGPTDVDDGACESLGLAGPIADFPCLSVRTDLARSLFPQGWEQTIRAAGDGAGLPPRAGKTVRITVPAVYEPARRTENVLTVLRGSALRDEYVLLGAHYDHLGRDAVGRTYCGADDNASGTAVLLAVARAFAESGLNPRRSVIFAAWTAEEAGLTGSSYFVSNPPFALSRLKAAINMDMVGLGEPARYETSGGSAYPLQYQTLAESARDLGLTLSTDELRAASDNLTFSRKGIPSLLVHSAGDHPNRHTINDSPKLIDPVILEHTARLVALTVWRLAQRP